MVSLPALFSASVVDFELFVENPRNFCPFFDAPLLIKFPERLVFLNEYCFTIAVHAFL